MNRKILLTCTAGVLLVGSTALASPLEDYSQGKASIDISMMPSPSAKGDSSVVNVVLDGKNSPAFGVTVGLGNDFAIQYKYAQNNSKDYLLSDGTNWISLDSGKIQSHELNVLTKLNDNISAFVGYTNAKLSGNLKAHLVNGSNILDGSSNGDSSASGYQVGLIGQTKIAEKLTAFGTLGIGNKIQAYEVGLGYGLTESLDLNIGYKYTKYKNLQAVGLDSDWAIKGFTYGLSYKF